MCIRLSSAYIAVIVFSSVAFVALPSAHACDMPPIIIVHRPSPDGGSVAKSAQVTAEIKNSTVAAEMVLFMVDGTIFAASKTPTEGAKYTVEWKTDKLDNGEHKLRASAVLADGSVLNSEVVPITVKNEPPADAK